MNKHIKLYMSLVLTWLFLALISSYHMYKIDTDKSKTVELLRQSMTHEAIAHFNNMVDTRKWNASHGGVYIKEHDGIKPNPYLLNNILKAEDNKTLIKINPAWMTRQISEIANTDNDYYYKITSLQPINPGNKADSFEKEALEYFEKNSKSDYYYKFPKEADTTSKFNFMGKLTVTPACMHCHEYQGYNVGDIRGGIRVSIPTNIYESSLTLVTKEALVNKYKTIFAALLIAVLITLYLIKSFSHTQKIEQLNEELEEKVKLRTKELYEINETLEEQVSFEVEQSRQKDEAMLIQSRQVAMGEMITMLAHQWRQPMASISMQANNVLIDIELGTEDITEIKNEIKSMSDDMQELSAMITTFSKLFNSDGKKSFIKLQNIIEDALSLLSGNLEYYNISVEKIYESESEVEIISSELYQVYWNILNNAKDILIEREISNPKIRISIQESESEIITIISDNAGGIINEEYEKVFEPYYSTKEDLNGRGLGLYTARVIVQKNLNGSIYAKNSKVGADFFIHIPKV